MFSGIVQTQATVAERIDNNGVCRLVIGVESKFLAAVEIGASIAINGVCLTVVKFDDSQTAGVVHFDVIDETLRLTNLANITAGDSVNFERSLSFGKEIGGHIVSGHIQTTATIAEIAKTEDNCRIRLTLDKTWMPYILHKGFISVDGASLTVGDVFEDGFNLHLIPETLSITTLGKRKEGDKLNIEVDQQTYTIVQTVQTYLASQNLKS